MIGNAGRQARALVELENAQRWAQMRASSVASGGRQSAERVLRDAQRR